MNDVIYRQQAIDAIKTWGLIDGLSEGQAIEILADEEKLPSAQPQRKKGRWIKVNSKTAINCSACYHCSWSLSFEDTVRRFNFCPNCGADMMGEQDE